MPVHCPLEGGVGGRRPSWNTSKQQWAELTHAADEGGKTVRLSCFCLEYSAREYIAFLLVRVGLMWFPFRLSVPETQLCEQWSGEAWTQPPMAISVERRQPNKQRKAWCAQVTAQPAVKKHLTLETIKAITCSGNVRPLITGQWLRRCYTDSGSIHVGSTVEVVDVNIFWIIPKNKNVDKGGREMVWHLQDKYYPITII